MKYDVVNNFFFEMTAVINVVSHSEVLHTIVHVELAEKRKVPNRSIDLVLWYTATR